MRYPNRNILGGRTLLIVFWALHDSPEKPNAAGMPAARCGDPDPASMPLYTLVANNFFLAFVIAYEGV